MLQLHQHLLMLGFEAVEEKLVGVLGRVVLHDCLFELVYDDRGVLVVVGVYVLVKLVYVLFYVRNAGVELGRHQGRIC